MVGFAIAAALAQAAQVTLPVTSAPAQSNLQYATPIAGGWTYSPLANGSEAIFTNAGGQAQLTIRCARSTRRVSILKAASSAPPSLWVWTSSQARSLPATFDASTARAGADLAAWDPLLDAIAASRGRIGFSTLGLAALVVPPWAEIGRVVEDCRV